MPFQVPRRISEGNTRTIVPSTENEKVHLNGEQQLQLPKVSPQEKNRIQAMIWLSTRLDKLPVAVDRADIFHRLRPTVLHKFELCRHTDSNSLLDLHHSVIERALSDRPLRPFLSAALGRMSFFLNHDAKVQLLEGLFADKRRAGASLLIAQIVTHSRTRKEGLNLINALGDQAFLERGSIVLKEIHAICRLGERLIALPLTKPCSRNLGHSKHMQSKYDDLRETLQEGLNLVRDSRCHLGTVTRREYMEALKTTLRDLERSFGSATTARQKREVINATILRFKLERRYILTFKGSPKTTENQPRSWSAAELSEIEISLRQLKEGIVIFTPCLFVLRRVDKFNGRYNSSYAIREDGSGAVEFSDAAIQCTEYGIFHRRRKSIPALLMHELGHSFSDTLLKPSRDFRAVSRFPDRHAEIFAQDFLALSDWQQVTAGFNVIDNGYAVQIGERKFPLGRPVDTNGRGSIREYRYNEDRKMLFSNNGYAEFVEGGYARYDPWEDYAETFSDYVLRPKSLIEHAPQKYLYLDGLHHLHDGNARLQTFLASRMALKRRIKPSTANAARHDRPLVVELFNRLSLTERGHLVDELALKASDNATNPTSRPQDVFVLDREKLARHFNQSLQRRPKKTSAALASALLSYNPALIVALRLLHEGNDVAIFSERSDGDGEEEAQKILGENIKKMLGYRFDPKHFYLLHDPKKNGRIKHVPDLYKAAHLLSEFASGNSIRGGRHVKPLVNSYQHVTYYDFSSERIRRISNYIKNLGLTSKLTLVPTKTLDVSDRVTKLMSAVRGDSKDSMHVFALDGCLVELGAAYYVSHKVSGDILKTVSLAKFQLHPDPLYWINLALVESPGYSKASVTWDDSDFCDLARTREMVTDGLTSNMMFRRLATSTERSS